MKEDKHEKNDLKITTTSGQKFEIPLEGNLGLLALGDIGLIAWRQKKLEFAKRKTQEKMS